MFLPLAKPRIQQNHSVPIYQLYLEFDTRQGNAKKQS